eukprot:gnl/TRDRNA2_/TRDRNA2_82233_c0_seq1.p1 gnl/TRDRNA2_/TRDRNA2_82233_c0~~gnl/TRDRNA2_/TRDRNA2_82233_c0_seq1.p1  ORF type:complete len:1083 (-),score=224.36 gnl/TRDRNA2_/TRDRNA2_82233_c0_seq1:107-3310(-)
MSASSSAAAGSWQKVQQDAMPAIVALQVTAVRSFMDNQAGAHGGTGFVVDAARGLLLTNRHVCTCGPERATATFVGCSAMEEVPVRIVYVDPVHDFAFLRFDPGQLEQTPHAEIVLDPAGCRVGEEIKIMGNDSLEKLQILSGTIARVDRNVPELSGDYNDENTFYALAGSGTRGGSSGSPVLNCKGKAVALNAAAVCDTMHGLFLPLHRVVRALEAVRRGAPVPRGTIGAAFSYVSIPECTRLGVAKDYMQQNVFSQPLPSSGTFTEASPPGGMLKVQRCMPGSPAAKVLQPGDVLMELEGRPCVDFVILDAVLDGAVENKVRLAVCRSGKRIDFEVPVQDLHGLIPHEFIELGLGIFHEVSYQTAQKYHIPLEGIYVAQAGFVFGEALKSDAVIVAVNGMPCLDLRAFEETLRLIPDKEYFTINWMVPRSAKERRRQESLVKMQRQWYSFRYWSLDRATHTWSPRRIVGVPPLSSSEEASEVEVEGELEDTSIATAEGALAAPSDAPLLAGQVILSGAAAAIQQESFAAPGEQQQHQQQESATTQVSTEAARRPATSEAEAAPPAKRQRKGATEAPAKPGGVLEALQGRICSVTFRAIQNFDMDLLINHNSLDSDVVCCRGAGVIIDSVEGFILTDRGTVPQALGDIEVTLGEVSRSASVWFVHPVHSIVVLRLDKDPESGLPSAAQSFGVAAKFEERNFAAGMQADFVGIDGEGQIFASEVKIQAVRLADFPSPSSSSPLRWREHNLEAIGLVDEPPNANGGVLCNAQGHIHALYIVSTVIDSEESKFAYCLSTQLLLPLLEHLRGPTGGLAAPLVPSLEINLQSTALQKLKKLPPKLRPPACWLKKLGAEGKGALQVTGVTGLGPCDGLATEGDLLVAVRGEAVATARAVEVKLQQAAAEAHAQRLEGPLKVELTLLTRGKERQVTAAVPLLGSDGTRRLLVWHGLVLREMPRVVREFGGAALPAGVQISQTMLGSPAEAHSVEGDLLVAVGGVPTPTLDALVGLDREGDGVNETQRRHIRVESVGVDGQRFTTTLEPDNLFWPTLEISQDKSGAWSCVECDC